MKNSVPEISLKRKFTFGYILIYVAGIFVATSAIHEGAHMISAVAIGVPLNEIKLGFLRISPSLTIPERFASIPLSVYHYSGGLTAATILLSFYLLYWLRKYHSSPSFLNWMMGLITVIFVAIQMAQGYIEGRFHAAYVYDAIAGSFFQPVSWVINISIFLSGIVAIIVHSQLFSLNRIRKGKGT